jgi:hypothetical protein
MPTGFSLIPFPASRELHQRITSAVHDGNPSPLAGNLKVIQQTARLIAARRVREVISGT